MIRLKKFHFFSKKSKFGKILLIHFLINSVTVVAFPFKCSKIMLKLVSFHFTYLNQKARQFGEVHTIFIFINLDIPLGAIMYKI